ncbi:PTS sugar transporter subunit IIB [Mycetocola reblochoni]|uniref:PTS system, lactose/cellobiose specific IIB subunit n=2 Tax=Mycetocola reblochoni TaxID=331618 RepID=A0A1R4K096_9MICO|nr:PTS sugar transporter subunit IIB [Mycetocola reblochoni]RLP70501.1 PTS sugar transporter subunit IIB [Mycetocola reblochoni]SJN37584.1 PTS system, lactose/cellobiose specific IIB subunit [Mycetocola reblochoni REB411]
MRIVAVCGVGVGSSAILKLNAERALARLGLTADVSASDIDSVGVSAADAQVILTSPELVDRIGPTAADVVVIENYFDLDEVTRKVEDALS